MCWWYLSFVEMLWWKVWNLSSPLFVLLLLCYYFHCTGIAGIFRCCVYCVRNVRWPMHVCRNFTLCIICAAAADRDGDTYTAIRTLSAYCTIGDVRRAWEGCAFCCCLCWPRIRCAFLRLEVVRTRGEWRNGIDDMLWPHVFLLPFAAHRRQGREGFFFFFSSFYSLQYVDTATTTTFSLSSFSLRCAIYALFYI